LRTTRSCLDQESEERLDLQADHFVSSILEQLG